MKQQVSAAQLVVGQPLPWDVFGQDGVLLLKRGQTIESQRALERFVAEGLYVDAAASNDEPIHSDEAAPSPLQHVLDARRHLAAIFNRRPEAQDDFPARIDKAIASVLCACAVHPRVALSSILLLQDGSYTVRHPVDVAILTHVLADATNLPADTRHSLIGAALTMNIGMYEVQDKINALAGSLGEKLLAMIHTHPAAGSDRLEKLGIADPLWLQLVRQHHENLDGSGYPAGLVGAALAPGANIIAVADRYAAMVSARGYRGPQKPPTALRELYVKHAQTLDVAVVGMLIQELGLYPVGTLVRLVTGEISAVTGPGESPETPDVHALITKSGAALEVASHRKTHLAKFAIEEVITIDSLKLPVRMSALWGKDALLR